MTSSYSFFISLAPLKRKILRKRQLKRKILRRTFPHKICTQHHTVWVLCQFTKRKILRFSPCCAVEQHGDLQFLTHVSL